MKIPATCEEVIHGLRGMIANNATTKRFFNSNGHGPSTRAQRQRGIEPPPPSPQALFEKLDLSGDQEIEYSALSRIGGVGGV